MALREILVWPEDCLKKKAEEIHDIDFHLVSLAEDMVQTMYAAPGVGLAAPQIGESKRLIVLDPHAKESPGDPMVVVNPVIAEGIGKEFAEEMCLSVPNFAVEVPRYTKIMIKGFDLKGKPVEIEAEGFLARILQHEIDHLNGQVIIGYASSLKRSIYLKKAKKAKKGKV
ncbi:MAG: peptide deformylase [Syntrophaceae bacterium]